MLFLAILLFILCGSLLVKGVNGLFGGIGALMYFCGKIVIGICSIIVFGIFFIITLPFVLLFNKECREGFVELYKALKEWLFTKKLNKE